MTYIIPKQLKEEMKLIDRPIRLWWKDFLALCVLLGTFLMFKTLVHSWLIVPYWIIASVSSLFLIQPAPGNPKKRNWEAIILYISKDQYTHYSINHVPDMKVKKDA
ncbi:DUF5592 family protein [Thermocaproicibacter melissae]|uniref:DUF5592 family protein n=1 Tax=Thermocaproicibacter melissae TaxID=2966552 RepID=UPI0024B25E13|nr:DUF5592 family protein [Thermocaproicibacter melissae]WBY64695.1 DUF5592 family protein [Thermocaproicibacter melissae]